MPISLPLVRSQLTDSTAMLSGISRSSVRGITPPKFLISQAGTASPDKARRDAEQRRQEPNDDDHGEDDKDHLHDLHREAGQGQQVRYHVPGSAQHQADDQEPDQQLDHFRSLTGGAAGSGSAGGGGGACGFGSSG